VSEIPTSPLTAALAAAQAEVSDPARTKTVTVPNRPPRTYAGLDDLLQAVRPVFARHGIAIVQTVELLGESWVLATQLRHTSGEVIVSYWPLTWAGGPQDQGARLTYARRYSLEAACGVAATDDDDAEPATKPEPRRNQRAPVTPPSSSPQSPAESTAGPARVSEEGQGHHPSWRGDAPKFLGAVGKLPGPALGKYEVWAPWCEEHEWPDHRHPGTVYTGRPSALTVPAREALYQWLRDPDHRAEVVEWLAIRAADNEQAAAGGGE
jgi:hypothetical protein